LPERKQKRKNPLDLFGFDEDIFSSGNDLESAKDKSGGGSGYSISVTYNEQGKTVVKVQTYGKVDTAELRQDILKRYPGATVEGLEKQPLIRIIGEEDQKQESEKKHAKEKKKEKKKPTSIRIVE